MVVCRKRKMLGADVDDGDVENSIMFEMHAVVM